MGDLRNRGSGNRIMEEQSLLRRITMLEDRFNSLVLPEIPANLLRGFMMLPKLRGLWPVASSDENDDLYDYSEQGRRLTNTNTVALDVTGLVSYADFIAANSEYFTRADEAGLDITGNLTWGGWFRFDAPSTGAITGLIGKYGAAGQRAYMLLKTAANTLHAYVSVDGTATVNVQSAVTYAASTWFFIVGRYTPSTELAIFINGTWDTNVVAIPAAIFNSNAALTVGSYSVPVANFLDGQGSLFFLCADALSNAIIEMLFRQSRPLFGV